MDAHKCTGIENYLSEVSHGQITNNSLTFSRGLVIVKFERFNLLSVNLSGRLFFSLTFNMAQSRLSGRVSLFLTYRLKLKSMQNLSREFEGLCT